MRLRPICAGGMSIFCDDVRMEANGKQIFIGTYLGQMFISPSFPAALPTFAIVIRYQKPRGDSTDAVKFVVTIPGQVEPAFQAEVSREQINEFPKMPQTDDDEPIIEIMMIAQLRNFVIPQEGRIKVRAYRGDEEIRLGTLLVSLNPQPVEEAAN